MYSYITTFSPCPTTLNWQYLLVKLNLEEGVKWIKCQDLHLKLRRYLVQIPAWGWVFLHEPLATNVEVITQYHLLIIQYQSNYVLPSMQFSTFNLGKHFFRFSTISFDLLHYSYKAEDLYLASLVPTYSLTCPTWGWENLSVTTLVNISLGKHSQGTLQLQGGPSQRGTHPSDLQCLDV